MYSEPKDFTREIPDDIKEAVIKIEEYTAKKTHRDDWAIGNITCRKGAERLLRQYKELVQKLNKIEQTLKE